MMMMVGLITATAIKNKNIGVKQILMFKLMMI